MPMHFSIILIFLLTFFQLGKAQENGFPYQLENPDHVYLLPEVLEEVSGLTYYAPNQIACLNDEHGRMYVYDLEKREIVHKVRFKGDGDFEGIERVGDYIYAIKSNGKMYRFKVDITGIVEEIDSPFDAGNNVEGLGYQPKTNRLLVALKGDADIKGVDVKGKAVYAFDLNTEKYIKLPPYTLSDDEVKRVLGKEKDKIRPSGVAVHPLTDEVYVLASTDRALIVFHPDGKPKNLSLLKRSLFPQPEGITFSPDGDLFISNEQEGEGGTILQFKMK